MWGQARQCVGRRDRGVGKQDHVEVLWQLPKPKAGRGLPALIDDDPAPTRMDSDPAPTDSDPTLMD